jgi:hypothetical protein
MQLNTSRFFSDRVTFNDSLKDKLQVTNSLWDWFQRVISWIYSPEAYSNENRRTVTAFKTCLVGILGPERLQRICSRYTLDLDKLASRGNPLLTRDVAKIVTGAKVVSVEDVNEYILKNQHHRRFAGKTNFSELNADTLASVVFILKNPFGHLWEVDYIHQKISGRPTEELSRLIYDPFLADRERIQLVEENPSDTLETFVHNMTARVIKREMDVGTLIPAPNHPDGRKQFYYVSAKLVTGKGMLSYLFHPATNDTNLEAIRLFRGTSARNSDTDAISTLIVDLDRRLGEEAFLSGEPYEAIIREKLPVPAVEGGHSLGSNLVQWRLAKMEHIQKAYLYCGPGLPEEEVEKFNKKHPDVRLIIRLTAKDPWSSMGEAHIGYKSNMPEDRISFLKYLPHHNYNDNPHVAVPGREFYLYGAEEGLTPKVRDRLLYHKNNYKERIRSLFGPLIATILRIIRGWVRSVVNTRAESERGLKIGTMQRGRWQVDHFRTI